jgi:hypothetical protein
MISQPREGCLPRPRRAIKIAFARRLCPDLIMQPQPVSEEKPVWSPNDVFSRMVNDKEEAALGSVDLGISSKAVRYVIHMRDSKSSRNAGGHPPSCPGSSYANDESKLLASDSGGVSGIWGGSEGTGAACVVLVLSAGGVLAVRCGGDPYVLESRV